MHKKVLIVLIIIVLFIIAMVAFVISKTETEIEGLKLQYNEIVTTLKSYQERIALSERKEKKLDKLDEKSDKIMKQQEEHEKQIETIKIM